MTGEQKKILDETEKIYFDEGYSFDEALKKAKEVMQNEGMAKMEKDN